MKFHDDILDKVNNPYKEPRIRALYMCINEMHEIINQLTPIEKNSQYDYSIPSFIVTDKQSKMLSCLSQIKTDVDYLDGKVY